MKKAIQFTVQCVFLLTVYAVIHMIPVGIQALLP